MDFLTILKKCEPNITQIARDVGLSRQAVYLWVNGSMPVRSVFDVLLANEKYSAALSEMDYDNLREQKPLGRTPGSKNKG